LDRQIRELLEKDSQKPEDFESLLEKLSAQDSDFKYLLGRYQFEKKKTLIESWQGWFQLLGWWFARLLMYGTLTASLTAVFFYGKAAVNPLTYGLIGAALYYVLIQIFTPGRIARETKALSPKNETEKLKQLIEHNYEKKAD
jgi:hypothetical protein